MTSPNVDEEFVGVDGIVATGVYGVAVAPTTAVGALDASWTDQGETTDAGVNRASTRSATTRRGWQKNRKLRTLVTESATRFKFVLVQTSRDSVALFHGVPLSAGSIITDPGREWPLIAFDLDLVDSSVANGTIREYAPRARVVEVGEQIAVAGDGWGWPITIETEYDNTLGGHTRQWYSKFEVIPTITTALPTAQAVTEIVRLAGLGLRNVTAITIGGVNVTDFDIVSDTEIYFTLPAGSAGSAPIIATNPAGASAAKAYTRA